MPRGLDREHKLIKEAFWVDSWYYPSSPLLGDLRRGTFTQDLKDDTASFVASVRACTKNQNLGKGIKLHDRILRRGLIEQCSDALVTMYAKCGELVKAKELFDIYESRDVLTWTSLIAGYVQKGQNQMALKYFEQMEEEGLLPDAVTFTCILKACGNIRALEQGERIHDEIAKQALLATNISLGNALVDMYAKCGALVKAQRVLEELPARNAITWTALIAGYAQQGKGTEALNCFDQMKHEGMAPNAITFTCVLKGCGSLGAIDKGKRIHEEIAKRGLLKGDIMLATALVDMYAKCSALTKAQEVLEEFPIRDVTSWNALIAGYAQEGQSKEALNCFEQMKKEGVSPNAMTFSSILKVCGSIGAADKGEEVHITVVKQGVLANDVALGTALVDMYAKCGALTKAKRALEELPMRNVATWNALIAGYVHHGKGAEALQCYGQMKRECHSPDTVTFICIFKACGSIGAAEEGEKVHNKVVKEGLLGSNIALDIALVDMYVKCGALAKARQVLEELPVRSVTSWNAVMAGYAQQDRGAQALECYEQMRREGLSPDPVTFVSILKACSNVGAADQGGRIHDEISYKMLENDNGVGTALVNMYAKCGALAKARQVLLELPLRNVISWTALIAGYCQKGEGTLALNFFEQMQHEGFLPNAVTFICALKACGSIGAVYKGEMIHHEIAKQGLLVNDVILGTALVDMYAKCGAFIQAREVLEQLPDRNVTSWNALIAGYVQHCDGTRALICLEEMQGEGLSPDTSTFSCVLNTCSRLGLLDDAQVYFWIMSTKYGMDPELEHFACIIDLFGRAGHLEKAAAVIEKMPSCNSGVWSRLLVACRKWGDVNVSRWAFEHADKNDAAIYLIMADIFEASGMLIDAERVEAIRAMQT